MKTKNTNSPESINSPHPRYLLYGCHMYTTYTHIYSIYVWTYAYAYFFRWADHPFKPRIQDGHTLAESLSILLNRVATGRGWGVVCQNDGAHPSSFSVAEPETVKPAHRGGGPSGKQRRHRCVSACAGAVLAEFHVVGKYERQHMGHSDHPDACR